MEYVMIYFLLQLLAIYFRSPIWSNNVQHGEHVFFFKSGKLHPIGLRSQSRSSPSNPTRKGSPTTEWKRSTAWGAMAPPWHITSPLALGQFLQTGETNQNTKRHRRRVSSIEILIYNLILAPHFTSFVVIFLKFTLLWSSNISRHMQEIFQPWILDTTLGTIASGTFIRL